MGYFEEGAYVGGVEHLGADKLNTCGGEIERSRREGCTLTC